MKRSALLGVALLGVLDRLPAVAQQTGKTYRVGILAFTPTDRPLLDAFLRTLSGLGYREGQNLAIVYRTAGGDIKKLPGLASDLVRAKPDAIVAQGSEAIAAAKHATLSIPIVMAENANPVGSGFIASLAHPGGNITGTTTMNDEVSGKRLQLLNELVPHLRRVVVVRNPSNAANLAMWRDTESVAGRMGIQAFALDIASPGQIDAALKTVPQRRADAIIFYPDAVTIGNAARVVRLVAAQRLPAVYAQNTFTSAGGLMFYGVSGATIWAQAAIYVDRILKGAKPADLPVERPTTFELIVNLRTALNLGITVPQSILLRADQVIK